MESLSGISNKQVDFEKWLAERPKWIQTAAAKLATSRKMPIPEEVISLVDLCIAEANKDEGAFFEAVPLGMFGSLASSDLFRLRKLDRVVGVNAIQENASIDFGNSDISVVFGMNGTGKSGYSRILKHACGAHHRTEILSNVFDPVKTVPSCEITVAKGADSFVHEWRLGLDGVRQLRSMHVFDSAVATSYVDLKNEASYEPRRMRFLSSLIRICDAVSAELLKRKALFPKVFPAMPLDYASTSAAIFIQKLRYDIKSSEIESATLWSSKDNELRQDIEASLKQHDIAARTKQHGLDERTLSLFNKYYDSLKSALSDSAVEKLLAAKVDSTEKRRAAGEDAISVFSGSALDGIGNSSWRLMWEEARKFSEGVAYPERFFPVTEDDALCVLCHQVLDFAARKRMSEFEKFVKGGLEVAAIKAEALYLAQIAALPVLPEKLKWALDVDFLGVQPISGQLLYEGISARLAAVSSMNIPEVLPTVDWSLIDNQIVAMTTKLAKEKNDLLELSKDGKKAELELKLKELRAREWLFHHKDAVLNEVIRLKAIKRIEKAEAIAKTNALTSKKNSLADDELATGYRDRFISELQALGGRRLKVEPIAISEGKGKVSFKLEIKGAITQTPAGAVLSEGENRIVALAAFLADITGSGQLTPFVFDDPVSSLDQEFEERVVERLVELAKTRQVIVFTHRLSLLALVEDAIEARKRVLGADQVPTSLSVTTLRRVGNGTGGVDEQDVRHKKPKSGFTVLREQHLPRIRNYEKTGDYVCRDLAIKAVCGDFRILIERSVEKVLLNGLIERFRRSVQTQQIKNIAKITLADCAMIDEMMTRYSKYEHSQSDELAGVLPDPSELEQDLNRVIGWIEEFMNRPV